MREACLTECEERPASAVDPPTDLVLDSVSEFPEQGASPAWSSPVFPPLKSLE